MIRNSPDTLLVALQVITAKAVQSVLAQLGETDLVVAQWLNNFAADTSPLLGDEFILRMMREARFALLFLRIGESLSGVSARSCAASHSA